MQEISSELISTGIPGLDDILCGGLPRGKIYLLSGSPGTGKTTLSLQFVAEGIGRGERCLYISVERGDEDFAALAKAAGIFLDPDFFTAHSINISEEILEGPEQRIFHPEEMEPAGAMSDLLAAVKRVKPKRLVIDSLSDLLLLAGDPASHRRLVLAMRRELGTGECTVLISNFSGGGELDLHMETICHGVICLEQLVLGYGQVRRRLQVSKMRGRPYQSGWHHFRITTGGIRVFRGLVNEHSQDRQTGLVSSGNERLDMLFGGGLNRGSTTAILGAAGTGKTSLANQYMVAAARRGENVAVYLFDETEESFRERAEGLGLSVEDFVDNRLIMFHEIDVTNFSTGEFGDLICQDVEKREVRMVVIDTLSGYASALLDEKYFPVQLHELLGYLAHQGITTLLTVEQHGIFGTEGTTVPSVSYLADSVVLLRFFESRGQIKRALSVVKKRRGSHETTIREVTISMEGIVIGEPLAEMQGVLTGVPTLGV